MLKILLATAPQLFASRTARRRRSASWIFNAYNMWSHDRRSISRGVEVLSPPTRFSFGPADLGQRGIDNFYCWHVTAAQQLPLSLSLQLFVFERRGVLVIDGLGIARRAALKRYSTLGDAFDQALRLCEVVGSATRAAPARRAELLRSAPHCTCTALVGTSGRWKGQRSRC